MTRRSRLLWVAKWTGLPLSLGLISVGVVSSGRFFVFNSGRPVRVVPAYAYAFNPTGGIEISLGAGIRRCANDRQ